MKILALAAIRGYQRWISPHKGFCCALRAITGGDSCSAYGYQVIARFGLRRGLGLLNRRLELCGHVHRSAAPRCPAPAVRNPWRHKEQGHCDVSCDPSCDGPCDSHGCGLFEPSCDLGENRRRVEETKRDKAHLDALARRIAKKKKKQAASPPTPK
jgi:putative component of membrane protein insertase Oxa1/YidC/SpoIIIJ protein YidD